MSKLELEVEVEVEVEKNKKVCPQCKKTYVPNNSDPMQGTPIEKEQHITGLCSDACWDKFLGV